MARLVAVECPDQAVAEQIQIADRVQDLVLDEFVGIAKSILVEDAVVVDDDGIVEAPTQREALLAHRLDILHETKGASAADLLDERGRREIDTRLLHRAREQRVIKRDRERNLEAVVRLEPCPLTIVTVNLDGLADADESFGHILLNDARRLEQEHERAGAAIHDRHFSRADIDMGVVDAQSRHRR